MLRSIALFVVVFGAMTVVVVAAVPTSITVQGRLTDPSGEPLPAGTKTFQFRIFDDTTGGGQFWPDTGAEQQMIATDASGLWTARVGLVLPLFDDVFISQARWLQITVNGTTLPRVRLITVPFAFRVGTVDGALGGVITSKVTIGTGNTNTGIDAFVVGSNNIADDFYGVVTGGSDNVAGNFATVVSGGHDNVAGGHAASVGGGFNDTANGYAARIGGGVRNIASAYTTFIGGGYENRAAGDYSAIVGGFQNQTTDPRSFVGGGHSNNAYGIASTIAGGQSNQVGHPLGLKSTDESELILGVDPGHYGTVGGGESNLAQGNYSTVPGGFDNTANGSYSFAAGRNATANHVGSFVWSDSTIGTFTSTATQQFLIRAGGGVGIGTNAPEGPLHVLETSAVGATANDSSVAVFERNGGVYLSLLGADGSPKGVFFGDPPNPQSGCIVYDAELTNGLQFRVNGNLTKMALTGAGTLGLGTTSPDGPFHVQDGSAGAVTGNSNSTAILERNGENWLQMLTADGNQCGILFGIGTDALNGSIRYNVNDAAGFHFRAGTNDTRLILDSLGNLTADACVVGSNIACPSDARFKRDIMTLRNALDKVGQLRGVEYRWKADEYPEREFAKGKQVGLIAQEVREVVPQAVIEQSDGYLAVDYARLVPLLIESIKEQQKQIDDLKSRLDRKTP